MEEHPGSPISPETGDHFQAERGIRRSEDSQTHRSPLRLLVITIVAIFVAEVVAMIVVYKLPSLPYYQLTLVDAGIMTIMIFPVLYIFSFRPLIRQMEKSWRAEERLRTAHNELELRVQSRTEELRKSNSELEEEILERRRVEEALRETEKRSQHAEEIAHLGSWELDLVKDRLIWSDEVYRIFGLQPQEFGASYEAFLEAVHPEDRAAVDDAYSSSVRDGKDGYEIEHRVIRKPSGEVRIVHEKCEHFRNEMGQIVRSTGMVHDIIHGNGTRYYPAQAGAGRVTPRP
jgi:PAS domain S-box-containing protein